MTQDHHMAYRTLNYRLAIEIGWWSTILISRDKRSCHLCSYNALKNEAHFVLESPLHSPIIEKYSSFFENVVRELGSLNIYLFLITQSVEISLYFMETTTLCHTRELASLKPPWCTLSPISILHSAIYLDRPIPWLIKINIMKVHSKLNEILVPIEVGLKILP